jgi:sister-chromatid-cohesion protein PDS5
LIQLRQVPLSYAALLPLIAHDPESELKTMASRFLSRLSKRQSSGKSILAQDLEDIEPLAVEHSFVRLLYILAHHPDFSDEIEDLNMFVV